MSSIHDNQVVHVVNVIDKLCILSIICPDLDLYMYWLHVYIFYVQQCSYSLMCIC